MRILAAVALALFATAAQAKYDREAIPPATPVGKPINCLQLSDISSTQVHGDKTIDYIMFGRNKVYRNTLPYECPSLGFEERYLHKSFGGEICSYDTITVLQSPGFGHGPTCGLGQFQPIEYIKDAKPAKPPKN